MQGVGALVDDFLRRRPLPAEQVAAQATIGLSGIIGLYGGLWVHRAVTAGRVDSETAFCNVAAEIGSGSAWANLANAQGGNDGTSATSNNAGFGALTRKIVEAGSEGILFAVQDPVVLAGFTGEVWASTAAVTASIYLQLFDAADNALGSAKNVADFGEGELLLYTMGGAADLWGTGLTAQDLRDDGIKLAAWIVVDDSSGAAVAIDALRLTAHYTLSA